MSKQIKITVVGDIMCEPLMLKAAKRNNYDFNPVFTHIRQMFHKSDFVIGNLETPLAGEKAKYVNGLFSFNAPGELADAMVDAGIDFVSTANNHCLDRGLEGLFHTQKLLNEKGMAHSGTFSPACGRNNAYYCNVCGTHIAVVAYTYGTNHSSNKIVLTEEQKKYINLLRPETEFYYRTKKKEKKNLPKRIFDALVKHLRTEYRYYIRKKLGMVYNIPHEDDNLIETTAEPYVKQMQEDIRIAKKNADIVIFYPHVGGQFNAKPGIFTEFVFQKAIDAGCDAIVASHPHVVQKAEHKTGVPCFYSIGNFSMSPNSVYLLHENLPNYGLAVHLYVENKQISKITFSILKIVESKSQMLTVYPVTELYEMLSQKDRECLKKEVRRIYKMVTGADLENPVLQSEYVL